MTPSSLQKEIGKKSPFDLPEEEAYLNLIRTAALISCEFKRLFKAHGISESAYNVLRILRGSGDQGRPSQRIAPDMVAPVPDVTRLVDRLESAGLVSRQRSKTDRRVVHVIITKKGLDLLARLDQPVFHLNKQMFGHMPRRELETLSEHLAKARDPHQSPSTPSTP